MIKLLKYNEIDFEKYKDCVDASEQKNFFAQKEILDFLTKDWELLVQGNYEAVMPIPITKKLKSKVVLMPLFCQQLGVFSKKDTPEQNDKFLNFLEKHYIVYFYSFNAKNQFVTNVSTKKNYIIDNQDYTVLRKKYFKGRKSTVKSAQNLQIKEVELSSEVLDFINSNFKGLQKEKDQQKFIDFLKYLNHHQMLLLKGSYLEENLTNLSILIQQNNQLSLLGLVNKEEYKSENGASFLIDAILKENISDKKFDFLGGSIRGIEIFFKSFGSVSEDYAYVQHTKLQLLRKLFIQ